MADDTKALFAAIEKDDIEAIRTLLAADPILLNQRNGNGESPLMHAVYYGAEEAQSELLAAGAETDLWESAMVGRTERVSAMLDADPSMLDAFSNDGWTALHLAAFFGHPETVRALLARKPDYTLLSKNGLCNTPLHAAAANREHESCKLLLAAGASPNAHDGGGWNPLHIAAHNGDVDLIKILLAAGADASLKNGKGETPYDIAVTVGHVAAAEILDKRA